MKANLCLSALLLLLATHAQANCISSEAEPNDNAGQANGPVCDGIPVSGSVSSGNRGDWFYFDLSETRDVTLTLSHQSGADADWYLYEAGRTGTNQDLARRTTSSNPETGTVTALPPGRYFVEVYRYSGTPSYQLTLTSQQTVVEQQVDCGYGYRPAKPGNLTHYLTGSAVDACVEVTPSQQAVLLMGGGSDVDAAFTNRIAPRLQGGNIVVLRTSGADGYNDYLKQLTGAASVETLIINSRAKADSEYVEWAIRSAEFVWLAGGDQSTYIEYWHGTKVQSALQYQFDKGGIIGGTSAGNMVLSEFVYDPGSRPNAVSNELVRNFCHNSINISTGFLQIPTLTQTINDTHFANRDRMGRTVTLLQHLGTDARAIAIDERASLFITSDGQGVVDGTGAVYLLRSYAPTQVEQLSCDEPVVIKSLLRYKLTAGDQYNLLTQQTAVRPVPLSVDGRLPYSQVYTPLNPYSDIATFSVTAAGAEGVSVTPAEQWVLLGDDAVIGIELAEGYQLASVDGCYGFLTEQGFVANAVTEDCHLQVLANALLPADFSVIKVNRGQSGATLVQLRMGANTSGLVLYRDGTAVTTIKKAGQYNDQFKTQAQNASYQLCDSQGRCSSALLVPLVR